MTGKYEEEPENGPESTKKPFFDPSKLDQALGKQKEAVAPAALAPYSGMSVSELLEQRAAIDALLPARSLAEVDIEEEVLLQFARTKALYDAISSDKEVPANQRAQVANSCTAILDQLIKMQARIYGAERIKAIESALIRTLRAFDEAVQARFFELYERALEASAVQTAGGGK